MPQSFGMPHRADPTSVRSQRAGSLSRTRVNPVKSAAMSPPLLLLGVIFGSLGAGYFLYGRKQRAVIPLLAGLLLMVVPTFLTNAFALVVVGLLLGALPWLIRR